jgi:hypothetical protein
VTPSAILAEQIRVAYELLQESERTGALVVHSYHASLRAQLLQVSTSPTQTSLLGWARNFHRACMGARPPVSGAQKMPPVGHVETWASAEALERELQGDFRGAMVSFACALCQRRRIDAAEVEELERWPEPSVEALLTVLGFWIERGAAWRGPMAGRLRAFRARLEASSPPAAAPAPGGEDGAGEP